MVRCKWKSDGFERPARWMAVACRTLVGILGRDFSVIEARLNAGEKLETPHAVWWKAEE